MKAEVPVTEKQSNGGTITPAQRRWWVDPFGLLDEFTRDLDRPWKRPFSLFHPRTHASAPTGAAWMPVLDMFQQGETLMIRAELPGVKKEDMKITVDQGSLVLEGHRQEEKEVAETDFFRAERSFGTYYRRIPLAFKIDAETIKAKHADGILEIRIPLPADIRKEPDRVPIE